MSWICIEKDGITDKSFDAIVNAANEGLQAGSGVCGAIFRAAGYEELQKACDAIGHCDTGSAVITPGFRSRAKYIIHAVGPIWYGGTNGEAEKLYGAYYSSLKLAKENDVHYICFPLISTGAYGYPADEAWKVSLGACIDFIEKEKSYDISIFFAVPDEDKYETGLKILNELAKKTAVRTDWKALDMPQRNDTFILRRHFKEGEMDVLRKGNIPKEMEDKWFWYMEGDTLYAHRSWTGYCIYIVRFTDGDEHQVTVNRDSDQYGCTNAEEDIVTLNKLLDWWCQPQYDYYHEWLSETLDTLKKKDK